jgi:DNA-binding CsgD family transcriptional regulator
VNPLASTLQSHVDRIYDAALAPERWEAFLEALSKELRAANLHLVFSAPISGDRGVVASVGMDERYRDAYRSHFHSLNPWLPYYGPEAVEGEIFLGDAALPEAEVVRTEFYNDWMRPQRLAHPFAARLRNSSPGDPVSDLACYREEGSGPFDRESLDLVRRLIPHLQRALVIHARLGGAEMRAGAVEEALDRISGGLILLDEQGAPITINRTAEGILAMDDGLALDREGPRASTAKQTGELRRLLAEAAKTGTGWGVDAGAVVRLARPSGRSPLEAVVAPLRRESSPLLDRRATCAIFLTDPAARGDAPPAQLRQQYGLTEMEAEVASRLVRGMDLTEIGNDLGITIHTVRGHLKRLFAKTDTHRQTELLRMLLEDPGRIRSV